MMFWLDDVSSLSTELVLKSFITAGLEDLVYFGP
jgi:hypothetical protein